PVAVLQLRPTADLGEKIGKRTGAFETFKEKFNTKPRDTAVVAGAQDETTPEENEAARCVARWRESRRSALVTLVAAAPERYDGIPLGRVCVTKKNGRVSVGPIDWSVARRTEELDGLPAYPDHINVAPLFDLTQDQAEAWLAKHGIQAWKVIA